MGLDRLVRKGRSAIHGFGCFACRPFAAGDHVGTFEGQPVDQDGTYVLWVYDAEGGAIARRGTNVLRWLNHSTDPNAELEGFELYARRPIAVDEEITIDYGRSD